MKIRGEGGEAMNKEEKEKALMTYKLNFLLIRNWLYVVFAYISMIQELKLSHLVIYYTYYSS